MNDYLLLMHSDTTAPIADTLWPPYFARLRGLGIFDGGSAIGTGETLRKTGDAPGISHRITGYIRVRADSLDDAKALVTGNPVFEAGGTVEIRLLPRE